MSSTVLSSPTGRDSFDSSTVPAPTSAVSWDAVFAGAAGAAALSLVLLILGVGLGLSSVSPWSGQGITGGTFGVSTVLWLTFTQLAASGMGGYLAGRLRTRWMRTGVDEVYFRDTAHGFLAWAVASLVTAALLSSAIGSIVSTGAQVGGTIAGGAAATAKAANPAGSTAMAANNSAQAPDYFVDALFRRTLLGSEKMANTTPAPAADAASSAMVASDTSPASSASAAMSAATQVQTSTEAAHILTNAIAGGTLSSEDAKYLGQLVAQRTGLSPSDAEKRVTDTFARVQVQLKTAETAARDATDKARKASSYAALWIFVSLLVGAFISSLLATYGGRQRDLA